MSGFSKEQTEAARPHLVASWQRKPNGELRVVWAVKR